ncbi:MAG TPA: KEOPS complex Pcc1-like subunit [Methanothermococcus okinawensis]|uniref:KEOPS complex Pcc1-like subunit n=1 Tax=Methanothermococcus okinawensis TaxID=155863 RepID=A0A832YWB6_9EURY|nr:KEOPS complex Pcc1-like subunit [Methanothermococcus okinawensis]
MGGIPFNSNNTYKYNFSLEIDCSSNKEANILYNSILLEHLNTQIKSKGIMDIKENKIHIKVFANDLSILKASLYSYLRWIKVAESIYKLTL